jgi:hypothetical protein
MFNKFGKTEAAGRGLRDTIADANGRGVPTVVFVPRRNIEAWREFAGDLAIEIDASLGFWGGNDSGDLHQVRA